MNHYAAGRTMTTLRKWEAISSTWLSSKQRYFIWFWDNSSHHPKFPSQNCKLLPERLLEYIESPSHYKTIRNIAEHPKISLQVELPMSKLCWICHSFFAWKFSQGKIQAFITTIWDTWVELLLSSSTEAAVHSEIMEISTRVVPDSTYSIQGISRRNISVLSPDTQRVHQMEQYGSQEKILAEDNPPRNNVPRNWKTILIKILRVGKVTTTEAQINCNASEFEVGKKMSFRTVSWFCIQKRKKGDLNQGKSTFHPYNRHKNQDCPVEID